MLSYVFLTCFMFVFLQKYKKILFSFVIIIILTFFRQWRVTITTVNKTKPAVLCLILLSVNNGIKKKRALVRMIVSNKFSNAGHHISATHSITACCNSVRSSNTGVFDKSSYMFRSIPVQFSGVADMHTTYSLCHWQR